MGIRGKAIKKGESSRKKSAKKQSSKKKRLHKKEQLQMAGGKPISASASRKAQIKAAKASSKKARNAKKQSSKKARNAKPSKKHRDKPRSEIVCAEAGSQVEIQAIVCAEASSQVEIQANSGCVHENVGADDKPHDD